MQKLARSFGTHDGTFHADEVTACALLLLFNLIDHNKIVRTRDLKLLNTCEYVCDVGGVYDEARKLFDHHQVEYRGGLSSAGMILEYLKNRKILSEAAYHSFNDSLIRGIDAHDNGHDPQLSGFCSFSNVISNFTPIPHDVTKEVQDAAFMDALEFTKGHLERHLKRFNYIQSCRQIIAEAMESHQECLMFSQPLPWLELFFEMNGANHPALFVIMPSGKNWKLRAIPPTYEKRMSVRHPLPEEWAGLLDQELKRVSGISGAIFCHKGRFISVWETKEDALKALEYAMRKVRSGNK